MQISKCTQHEATVINQTVDSAEHDVYSWLALSPASVNPFHVSNNQSRIELAEAPTATHRLASP